MSMHPNELNCGQVFYECDGSNGCVEMKTITQPYVKDGAWVWKARNVKTEEVVDYLWTDYAYGPSIYDYPAYVGLDPVETKEVREIVDIGFDPLETEEGREIIDEMAQMLAAEIDREIIDKVIAAAKDDVEIHEDSTKPDYGWI